MQAIEVRLFLNHVYLIIAYLKVHLYPANAEYVHVDTIIQIKLFQFYTCTTKYYLTSNYKCSIDSFNALTESNGSCLSLLSYIIQIESLNVCFNLTAVLRDTIFDHYCKLAKRLCYFEKTKGI